MVLQESWLQMPDVVWNKTARIIDLLLMGSACLHVQALTDLLSKANARHEENTAALVEEVEALKKKVSSVCRRNEKLSDQLGFLNEVAIRQGILLILQLHMHELPHSQSSKM